MRSADGGGDRHMRGTGVVGWGEGRGPAEVEGVQKWVSDNWWTTFCTIDACAAPVPADCRLIVFVRSSPLYELGTERCTKTTLNGVRTADNSWKRKISLVGQLSARRARYQTNVNTQFKPATSCHSPPTPSSGLKLCEDAAHKGGDVTHFDRGRRGRHPRRSS